MGHKVHPYGFRLGVSRTWNAKWYADKDYTDLLKEDMAIRQLVSRRLANASVSLVEIERGINHVTVTVHTAKPGIVIGKGGANVEVAAPADRQAHDPQGQAGDQGDPPARARRVPRRDEHRPAADPPHRLPQGHQAGRPADHEGRRQGRQDRRSPVASAAPRWRAASGTRKAASRSARCAPTSATARSMPTPPTAASASRSGSTAATSCPSGRPREVARAQPVGHRGAGA